MSPLARAPEGRSRHAKIDSAVGGPGPGKRRISAVAPEKRKHGESPDIHPRSSRVIYVRTKRLFHVETDRLSCPRPGPAIFSFRHRSPSARPTGAPDTENSFPFFFLSRNKRKIMYQLTWKTLLINTNLSLSASGRWK